MRTFAELMDGLPPLPPEPERKEAPIDDGETITRHRLRFWLSRLDPAMPQPDWIKIIMGVHATPLENDPHANDRRQIARDWSEGLLDHRGRYENLRRRITRARMQSIQLSTVCHQEPMGSLGSIFAMRFVRSMGTLRKRSATSLKTSKTV
jgi:hypothetical protein